MIDKNVLFENNIPEFYPSTLQKACLDEFDYMLKTKSGERFRFRSAEPMGEWVRLKAFLEKGSVLESRYFPRGIDLCVDQIEWIADAPEGS